MPGARSAGRDERIELVLLRARRRCPDRGSAAGPSHRRRRARALSATRSISSEMSKRDCWYLIAPALACARFQSRCSFSVLTGADGPSDASHALKSRFMPYLKLIEQFASLPLACSAPEQKSHSGKLSFAVLGDEARDVGGIDDDRALLLQHRDGVGHHLRLFGVDAAARRRSRPAASRDRCRTRAARRCARPSGRRRSGTSCSRGSAAACTSSSPRRSDRATRLPCAPSMIAASATVRVIGPAVS